MKSVSSIAVNTIGIEEWNQFTMKQIESITKIAEEYGTQQARLAIEAAGKIAKQINERETQSVTNEGASTATLEGLEGKSKIWRKDVTKQWGQVLIAEHWQFLKPHLSALLKEKEEKIKEIEKINKENGELYESIMQQANNKIQELRAWKESAMEIMSPLQDIGKALGIKLGESIHDKILPAIKELKEQNELMQFGDNPIIQELKLELKEKKELLKNAVELCCFISDDGEPVDGFRFREIASELKRLSKQNV